MFHPDDAQYLAAGHAAKQDAFPRHERQLVRGRYSGVQRKIQCIVDCAGGSVATDHNGRRRYRKAAEALIYFTGLMVDARRDDAEMQRMLRRADGWLSSMLRMCKAYSRKALYWNHGKFLDGKLPDFYAMGLAALSLDGSESFAEVIEAVQRFQGAYIEPHTNSKGAADGVDIGGFDDGIKPRDSRKPRYDLSFAEYSAVKRLARASELRRVAGRVAFYKRRGDVHGFLNTMYGLMAGQVGHGGNKRGVNTAKHRFGGIGSALIGSVLVSSVSAMDAAGKVASFLLDGVIG
jgi:hypothetical protein